MWKKTGENQHEFVFADELLDRRPEEESMRSAKETVKKDELKTGRKYMQNSFLRKDLPTDIRNTDNIQHLINKQPNLKLGKQPEQTPHPWRCTDGKWADERALSSIWPSGTAKYSHNEMVLHIVEWLTAEKLTKPISGGHAGQQERSLTYGWNSKPNSNFGRQFDRFLPTSNRVSPASDAAIVLLSICPTNLKTDVLSNKIQIQK